MDPENGSPLDNPAAPARDAAADEHPSAETIAAIAISGRGSQNATRDHALTPAAPLWPDGAVNAMRCSLAEVPDAMATHVSVENQFPADLFDSMVSFIEQHPQWDQYRLMQSALAGFLFQQGCQDKPVVRHYLDGLFRKPEIASR
jgi:hypothetical protein